MVGKVHLLNRQDRDTERFWEDFEWNAQGIRRWPEDKPEAITDIYLGRFIIGPFKVEEVTEPPKRSVKELIGDWYWGLWNRLTRRCPKLK